MNTSKIIACGATLLLSGCGIYTNYEPQTSVPEQLYGEEVAEAVSNKLEIAFFVSAKKIRQVLTSLSQNLPVSLNFCILGNQVKISQR